MFKKQVTLNVELLDIEISKVSLLLSKTEDGDKYEKIHSKLGDLIKLRCELAESRVKESNTPMIVSGLVQVSTVLLVLHYEKTDIITSKVFGMATKLFKEGV